MASGTKKENRGGKRRGAGRPPVLSIQLEQAKALARRLHIGLQSGLDKLGEAYPDLMALAIRSARGEFNEGKPDMRMLAMLVEFLPRVVGEGTGEDQSAFSRLLSDVRARVVQFQQVNNYGPLPPGSGAGAGGTGGEGVDAVGVRVLEPGAFETGDGR